jgi:L-ascorbate metabolism protein UlaG (beta-lactamase superfamily)
MESSKWYLKPNVVIEPLVERWYAWAHIIAPATAAMNVSGRHLKIMNSYLKAPAIHEAAVRNPLMLGGPFMDYKVSRVEDIEKLKEETLVHQADLIELAIAIKELDAMLKANAKGYSLEELYTSVPAILKGYVELIYDLNNQPSYRFFEPLLYKSRFYNNKSQSIALWITENDERPFCLSTPRLNEPNVLHLNIPFRSREIDQLSRMKREGGGIEEIAALLNINDSDKELFNSFFTLDPPPKYKKYDGNNVRMRYFGHACILIETSEVSILVDPLISYYGYESSIGHFSDADLPDEIDYVLITHNHQDHILFETLLPLRHKIKNIIVPRTNSGALQDPNIKLVFNHAGFHNVVEIDEMETITFSNSVITGIPFTGEHCDLNIRAKSCFHIAVGTFSFLFVADSRIIEPALYQHIHEVIGDIDVVFLGMECDGAPMSWLYGPLLTETLSRNNDQSRRLSGSDFEKGIKLVDIFNPKEVYVYAMGQEPWVQFISSVKYTERLFGEKEILYQYEKAFS